jgi:hypothetical protein
MGKCVLACLVRCSLQVTDLRNKARLLVPEGTLLVGVMDEFDVLQEGQVFVQVGEAHSYLACMHGTYLQPE